MRIIGVIGGWDTNSHNAAAAAVEDGRVVFAIEEDRLTRDKLAFGLFPLHAVDACLEYTGWSVADVDRLALGWDSSRYPGLGSEAHSTIPPLLRAGLSPDRVVTVEHHLAHLASSYLCATPEPAAGIVIDGHGERSSVSLYDIPDGTPQLVGTVDIASSPGLYYESVASHCGLGAMSAGKLMGLAAYGVPDAEPLFGIEDVAPPDLTHFPSVENAIATADWASRLRSQAYPYAPSASSADVMSYANLAATAQRDLEVTVLRLVRWLRERVPHRRLLCAGGVFLNCATNTRVALEGGFDDVQIFPAANDAGAAAGAAIEVARRSGFPPQPLADMALGLPYNREQALRALRKWGFTPLTDDPAESIKLVAERLASGAIVLFFHGRSEHGPRALCQRSFLCSPAKHRNLLTLNRMKSREPWRPLAPVLLAEDYDQIFDTPYLPIMRHMLATAVIKPAVRHRIPAVTHIDGSSRPQVIEESSDHPIVRVLRHFRAATGLPCLINTSLNIGSEPIAEEPSDALRILSVSPPGTGLYLDGLYVER